MADARSILAGRLSQLRAAAYRDIDITDSHGRPSGLVVRYQSISSETFHELQEQHADEAGGHEFNLSVIIRACQALLIRQDDGRLVSIDTDDPDGAYVDEDGHLHGRALTYSSDRTLELLDVDTTRAAARTLHEHAELLIDSEATAIVQLSGVQRGDAGPERRSRASRS